jgi:hypothetical protein
MLHAALPTIMLHAALPIIMLHASLPTTTISFQSKNPAVTPQLAEDLH